MDTIRDCSMLRVLNDILYGILFNKMKIRDLEKYNTKRNAIYRYGNKIMSFGNNRCIISLLAILLSVCTSAQMGVGIGQWRTHFSYNATTHIAVTNDKVFALSSGSLYSVDKSDNLIRLQDYLTTTYITYHILPKKIYL